MSSLTFDTHEFVKRLRAVGFTEEQAEVFAREQSVLIEERLATKHDLESMKLEIKLDIKELEYRMVIKLGAMLVVAVAMVAALVKIL